MGFFAPYMLWGSVAAGIPVALHFLFRSRYRVVPWAAMEFLRQSIEQTSRRIRFQELLLLIVRTLVLGLLAFALARPSSHARPGSGAGDAVDAVLLFDVSYSMDAREGTTSRLDRAKRAALDLIDHLPAHSTVQVVTVADRAEKLGPQQPGDLEAAKQVVESVAVSQLATDLLPGVREAVTLLERGTSPNRELYLFGDMQKLGWQQQAGPLGEQLRRAHDLAAVTLVRCGTKTPRNVAVVGVVPQSTLPHVGERVGFAVLIRNAGSEPVRDLTVTLTLDGDKTTAESQPVALLNAGETRTVPLSGKWDKPGLRVVSASVGPDELDADNRLDLVIPVREQVRILVVDGAANDREPEKAASFYLLHALLPVKDSDKARYHLQPRVVTPGQATAAHLGDKDLCVLVNCAVEDDRVRRVEGLAPEFCDALERFVRGGKPLMIFAGDRTPPESNQRILGDRHQLLPLKLTGVATMLTKGEVTVDRASVRDPAFWKFRDDDAYQPLANVRTARYLIGEPLADKAVDPVLLRFSDGSPLLAIRKAGAGQVMLCTTSADATWTDWPLWLGMYVPFVDLAVNKLILGSAQDHNGTAGEPIRLFVPEADAAASFVLRRPDGRTLRLPLAEAVQGRPMVSATDTQLAGVYRVAAADDAEGGVPFALAADPREGLDLTALTDREIDDALGFAPTHLTAGDDASSPSAERLKREWTVWLLLAVLGFAAFEAWLAWWCGQAR
ncbi:MAG: BatA domain-containing protein [Gemmataceae bacterium]